MKTLMASMIAAVTTFVVMFAGLSLRSARSDAALFWQLERMSHGGRKSDPSSLARFATALRSKTKDPDLRACAAYQQRRSEVMLMFGFESSWEGDDSATAAKLLINAWKRPSGVLALMHVMAQETSGNAARMNCVEKFSRTDADRNNIAISGLAAFLTLPLIQIYRRYQPNG